MHMPLSVSLMCGALTCGSPTLIHYSNAKLQLIIVDNACTYVRLPWSSQSHLIYVSAPVKVPTIVMYLMHFTANIHYYSTSHRQHQNETHSNMFAAQLKRVYVHHNLFGEQLSTQSRISARSKLLLTNQPVHGKRCFMICPS